MNNIIRAGITGLFIILDLYLVFPLYRNHNITLSIINTLIVILLIGYYVYLGYQIFKTK